MCITIFFFKRTFFFKNKDFLLCLLIPNHQLETAWGRTVRLRKRSEPGEMSLCGLSGVMSWEWGLGLGTHRVQQQAVLLEPHAESERGVKACQAPSQDVRTKLGSPNSKNETEKWV